MSNIFPAQRPPPPSPDRGYNTVVIGGSLRAILNYHQSLLGMPNELNMGQLGMENSDMGIPKTSPMQSLVRTQIPLESLQVLRVPMINSSMGMSYYSREYG